MKYVYSPFSCVDCMHEDVCREMMDEEDVLSMWVFEDGRVYCPNFREKKEEEGG